MCVTTPTTHCVSAAAAVRVLPTGCTVCTVRACRQPVSGSPHSPHSRSDSHSYLAADHTGVIGWVDERGASVLGDLIGCGLACGDVARDDSGPVARHRSLLYGRRVRRHHLQRFSNSQRMAAAGIRAARRVGAGKRRLGLQCARSPSELWPPAQRPGRGCRWSGSRRLARRQAAGERRWSPRGS